FYSVLSPKSMVQSITRVVVPWADVASPSRVRIDEVMPGDATIFTGRQLSVTARISGLYTGEQPTLYYTTLDQQNVDVPVEFEWDALERQYRALLPPSAEGVQQDLRYRIEAGDATTADFLVQVQAEP